MAEPRALANRSAIGTSVPASLMMSRTRGFTFAALFLGADGPGWSPLINKMPDSVERKEIQQADKFKEAARELSCDDDPARFRERLGKLLKHKPVEKPE